jgi:tripartite-type tricarboxylate transporter receptor subunit TctC
MNGAPAPRSGTPPDGHTLIMVSVTHSINAALYSRLPYDTIKSFTPVSPTALLAGT